MLTSIWIFNQESRYAIWFVEVFALSAFAQFTTNLAKSKMWNSMIR